MRIVEILGQDGASKESKSKHQNWECSQESQDECSRHGYIIIPGHLRAGNPNRSRAKIRQELPTGSSTKEDGTSDGADSLVVGHRRVGSWRKDIARVLDAASGEEIVLRFGSRGEP